MRLRANIERWHEHAQASGYPGLARLTGSLVFILDLWDHLLVDRAPQTSAALAYTTILSLVPLLAVSFALLKAVVSSEEVAVRAQSWLLSTFLADCVSEVTPVLESLLERAQGSAVGLVGFIFLMVTSLSLFMSVEKAFNRVWRVPITRPLHRRLTAYYAVLTLTPTLVALGLGWSAWIKGGLAAVPFGLGVAATLLPWTLEVVALVLMYKLMPHTTVYWRSALVGALGAAVVFNLSKAGFNYYITAIYAGSVSARIYGSFALVPIFFLWVYLIWLIVIGGGELAYMYQNRNDLSQALLQRRGRRTGLPAAPTGYLVSRVFLEIGRHFRDHGGGVAPSQVAAALQIAVEEVQPALQILRDGGLTKHTDAPEVEVLPARPLHQVRLTDLYALTESEGYKLGELPTVPYSAGLERQLRESYEAAQALRDQSIDVFLDLESAERLPKEPSLTPR